MNCWRKICFPCYNIGHVQFQQRIIYKRLIYTTANLCVKGMPIKMPSLSPTMMEGTIVKWLKQEGDTLQPGDLLCDIQTDKAVVAFELDEEGVLAKILVKEDTNDIKIGTLIALMVEEGQDWKSVEMPDQKLLTENEEQKSTLVPEEAPSSVSHTRRNFGPSVQLLLEKFGITAGDVSASGPHGILLKGDVLKVVQERNLQPKSLQQATPAITHPSDSSMATPLITMENYSDIEVTNLRKTIAKRLLQSKTTISHTYSTLNCRIDELLNLRKEYKMGGSALSVNDFIVKGVSVALRQHPKMNSVWEGTNLSSQEQVDICIAVATDSGLITPIIFGADLLGLEEISTRIRNLAARAKENKLTLNEFQGGTFTISNLGMLGISEFTAIINPPQCAILAVGTGILSIGDGGKLETRMSATLSYDQAAISDDEAALFLQTLKEILENPANMLLGSYQRNIHHPMAALL